MKTLNFISTPGSTRSGRTTNTQNAKIISAVTPMQTGKNKHIKWWNLKETKENVGPTEAIIRGMFIFITLPTLTAVDWSYKTDLLVFVAPVLFYLEVSAFTMFCPIKALISKYKLPEQFD